MMEYYRATIERKLLRNEPLFFYHHPSHRAYDVMKYIFTSIQERGISNVTMGEYSRWWKNRRGNSLHVSLNGAVLSITYDEPGEDHHDIWLHISRRGAGEMLAPLSGQIDLTRARWVPGPKPVTPPPDLRRIRDFDPRAMLGDLYGKMMRRLK
jgi:hypothetical protein